MNLSRTALVLSMLVLLQQTPSFAQENIFAPEINAFRERQRNYTDAMDRKYVSLNRARDHWNSVRAHMDLLRAVLNARPATPTDFGLPQNESSLQLILLITARSKSQAVLGQLEITEQLLRSEFSIAEIDLSLGDFGPGTPLYEFHQTNKSRVLQSLTVLRQGMTQRLSQITTALENWNRLQDAAIVRTQAAARSRLAARLQLMTSLSRFTTLFELMRSRFENALQIHDQVQADNYFDAFFLFRERIENYFGTRFSALAERDELALFRSRLDRIQSSMQALRLTSTGRPQAVPTGRSASKSPGDSEGDAQSSEADNDPSDGNLRVIDSTEVPHPPRDLDIPGNEQNSGHQESRIRLGEVEFTIHGDNSETSTKELFEGEPSDSNVQTSTSIELHNVIVFSPHSQNHAPAPRHEPVPRPRDIRPQVTSEVHATIASRINAPESQITNAGPGGGGRAAGTIPSGASSRPGNGPASGEGSTSVSNGTGGSFTPSIDRQIEGAQDLICYARLNSPRPEVQAQMDVLQAEVMRFANRRNFYNGIMNATLSNLLSSMNSNVTTWTNLSNTLRLLPNLPSLALSPNDLAAYNAAANQLANGAMYDLITTAANLSPGSAIVVNAFNYVYNSFCGNNVVGEPVTQQDRVLLLADLVFGMVDGIFPEETLNMLTGFVVNPAIQGLAPIVPPHQSPPPAIPYTAPPFNAPPLRGH